jgi:hypothetical protein
MEFPLSFSMLSYEETLRYSSIIMIVTSVATFISLLFIKAPYGRHGNALSATEQKYWGPMIPARVAWVIMESPTLCWCAWFVSQHGFPTVYPHKLILLGCFIAHYFHRALLYPFYSTASSSSPMPLSIMFFAFSFCTWNGYNQSLSLIVVHQEVSKDLMDIMEPLFVIGVSMFVAGMMVNIYSDWDLVKQRKVAEDLRPKGAKKAYIIPRGFFYNFISCPNYGKHCMSACG